MPATMLGGIHHRFAEVARRLEQRVALRVCGQETRFDELFALTGRVASALQTSGCAPPQRIGVFSRDHALIIGALLGILQVGCAFAPLDAALPDERLRRMVELSELAAIFVDRELRARLLALLGESDVHIFDVDSLRQAPIDSPPVFAPYDPDAPCSIYFTSGSTGMPRAVLGRLCGIEHHIAWEIEFLKLDASVRGSVLHSPSYDAYLPDVLVPLCAGGVAIVPQEPEVLLEPQRLCAWLQRERITLLHCVPSLFRALLHCPDAAQLTALRHVLLAGEVVRPADVRAARSLFGDRVQLVNLYGPTEATLVKLHHAITALDGERPAVPIGVPMPQVKVHLLSDDGQEVAAGCAGQLAIQSRYGAHGYLHEPALTRERFIDAPDGSGERIYLTGDYGQRLPDGTLAFLGRRDRQLKLRGKRVELDDIEALLGSCAGVAEAAVIAGEDGCGDAIVHGFVILSPGTRLVDVRRDLERRAPPVLRPSTLTALERFPRTASGKLDRRQLVPPGHSATREPPQGDIERELAVLWRELLGIEHIGRHEHFFELGGHSLSAARLLGRIRERFAAELPLSTLFAHPTLAALASLLHADAAPQKEAAALPPIDDRGFPPTPEQRSLLMFEGFYPGSPVLNIFLVFRLRGALSVPQLAQCLSTLHTRHGALRSAFIETDDALVVRELDTPFSLEEIDLRDHPEELPQVLRAGLRKSFALERGIMWSARLLRIDQDDFYLALCSHHIASDGTGYSILLRELSALYQAGLQGRPSPLPAPGWRYPHYAAFREELLRGPRQKLLSDFCLFDVKRSTPPMTLPTDKPRRPGYRFDGDQVCGRLEAGEVAAMTELGLRHGATFFMTLCAGLLALLHHATAARRVTIINAAENRGRKEVESIVGLFANFILIGADFDDEPDFATLLERVRERVLSSLAHQDTPFDSMLEAMQSSDEFVTPEVMLTMFGDLTLTLPGVAVERVDVSNGTTTHDLMIHAEQRDGGVLLGVSFRDELFERSSIERFITSLCTLLAQAVAAPGLPTQKLPIITSGAPLFVMSPASGSRELA
jgi:amino acid adenylation domain-containing protein